MKIEKIHKLCILKDSNIYDESYIFNSFYQSNSKIIYIVDINCILKGIITIGDFLRCIRNNSKDYIRYSFSVITADTEESIFDEAEKVICEKKITTAIPVVDKEGKLVCEVKFEILSDESTLQKSIDKFKKFEESYYLKDEINALKRILCSQKIYIIGNEKLFENVFGVVFSQKSNIVFLDNIEDAYSFLSNREYLLIDLNTSRFECKEEIYRICNNGYSWDGFYEVIFENIQKQFCSQILRVLDNRYCTLEEWANNYVRGKIDIITNSILYNVISEISSCQFVNFKQTLIRDEYCKYITADGVLHNTSDFAAIIRSTDTNIQMAELNILLKNKVSVLNFVCQKHVIKSINEDERISKPYRALEMLKAENCAKLYAYDNYKLFLSQLKEEFNIGITRRVENDFFVHTEYFGKIINITNGLRKTCRQPEEYVGTIYMCGVCTIFGSFVEDKYTIPSIVQDMISKSNRKYRVVNLGNVLPQGIKDLVKKIEFNENDLVITFFPLLIPKIQKYFKCIDISNSVNVIREKYPEKDLFCDSIYHTGTFGNLVYAEAIYNDIEKYLNNEKNQHCYPNNVFNLFKKDKKDMELLYGFESFIKEIHSYDNMIPRRKKKIGCIVMNCNPFTKGHRYLVEYAVKRVDFLYLFVVEEDRSYFHFKDRIEMVKRGTNDLENVLVIRSGEMIASDITFPAYFNSERKMKHDVKISPATDLRVFSQYIAPEFGICYRFVGEEPYDICTNQYHFCMKEILPLFGISVVEIPRKVDKDNKIISASNVRKFYEQNNFESLKELVPNTTLEYLKKLKGKLA